jgi:type II secretory pathway component PulF
MAVVLWLIYSRRFHTIAREEKRARESIIKELPEFINKLVLLINAGVILNTAFLKIIEDCDEKRIRSSYFYRRIYDIGYMVRETNASFYSEMYSFAKYSGVKELMRITNIMVDNINKGDDLSDKLRRENELLWFARKQQAEEKGRLAETKLTLPLMILLTVLIMVTISPALMEI